MLKTGNIISKVTFVISLISYGGVLIIMLLNVVDVCLAKLLSKPIVGAYEITECLLLCTVMASFAYAQSQKAHINMSLIIKRFPRVIKFSLFGLMGLLSTGTAGVVGYAAFVQAGNAIAKGTQTTVLGIPMFPFYYIESAAMFVFAIALLFDTIMAFMALGSKQMEEIVVSSWAD